MIQVLLQVGILVPAPTWHDVMGCHRALVVRNHVGGAPTALLRRLETADGTSLLLDHGLNEVHVWWLLENGLDSICNVTYSHHRPKTWNRLHSQRQLSPIERWSHADERPEMAAEFDNRSYPAACSLYDPSPTLSSWVLR